MIKRARLFAIVGAIALEALPAFAQPGPDVGPGYGYGHMWDGGWGWGWYPGMIFGPLMMLIFVVGVIAVFVWLVRGFGHGAYGHFHGRGTCPRCGFGGGRGALDTLEQRFAKGEIDKAEFEEKRKLLS